jgi:hypothetical protein
MVIACPPETQTNSAVAAIAIIFLIDMVYPPVSIADTCHRGNKKESSRTICMTLSRLTNIFFAERIR